MKYLSKKIVAHQFGGFRGVRNLQFSYQNNVFEAFTLQLVLYRNNAERGLLESDKFPVAPGDYQFGGIKINLQSEKDATSVIVTAFSTEISLANKELTDLVAFVRRNKIFLSMDERRLINHIVIAMNWWANQSEGGQTLKKTVQSLAIANSHFLSGTVVEHRLNPLKDVISIDNHNAQVLVDMSCPVGSGGTGKVYFAEYLPGTKKKGPPEKIAFKLASEAHCKKGGGLMDLITELDSSERLNSRSLVLPRFGLIYREGRSFYAALAVPFIEGESLYDKIYPPKGREKEWCPMTDFEKARYTIDFIDTVAELNQKQSCRDIKPDNAMILNGRLVLIDMGSSIPKGVTIRGNDIAGTVWYWPPEVVFQYCRLEKIDSGFEDIYGEGLVDPILSDSYCTGISIAEIHGVCPEFGTDYRDIMVNILQREMICAGEVKVGSVEEMVNQLCNKNIDERKTVSQIRSHPFYKSQLEIVHKGLCVLEIECRGQKSLEARITLVDAIFNHFPSIYSGNDEVQGLKEKIERLDLWLDYFTRKPEVLKRELKVLQRREKNRPKVVLPTEPIETEAHHLTLIHSRLVNLKLEMVGNPKTSLKKVILIDKISILRPKGYLGDDPILKLKSDIRKLEQWHRDMDRNIGDLKKEYRQLKKK